MAGKKGNRPLLPVAAVLCLISVAAMVIVLIAPKKEIGEFVPPDFDTAARVGTPEVPQELGWQEFDARLFQVSVCGRIVPNGTDADLWLTNPERNDVWLKVRILNQDGDIVGESGLIKPGEYVQTVALTRALPVGAKITLKIMAYEPNTYHSAGALSLETQISG